MTDALHCFVDQDLLVRVRRELHMHPELGWDLDRTTALVRRELDAVGIPYEFEKYGRNTIVATVNPEKTGFTIGIRGDMDALPIQEKNEDKPYRSQNPGVMHACGHDTHTAMLIGACKALYAIRDQLTCRVRLIFQPSEETRPSGARTMCEHGVMDDIDCIIMCHVNCNDPTPRPSCRAGITNASTARFKIVTKGRAVHVASPHRGVDALAMAVKIYDGIQLMLSRETDPFDTVVFSVCTMHAGTTISANADRCEMSGSVRCFRESTMAWARERVARLVKTVCEDMRGDYELEFSDDPLPPAYNDAHLYEAFVKSAEKVGGPGFCLPLEPSPGGEDFAYYEQKKPGLLFGLGLRSDEKGFNKPAHTCDWDVDESGMETGVRLFIQFVLDHMNGVPGLGT
ncbi:MAG: amidohydrolase [Clostridiales bacterium]|nr:amidohydrolase [Clostridiales bacterium]